MSASEITGTGYTAGGVTLSGKQVEYDTTNNRTAFKALQPSWTSPTITARDAVVYKSTGNAATSPLIGLVNFGEDRSVTGGTFTVAWSGDHVLRASAVAG